MILSIKTVKYRIAVIQMAFILAGIPMSTALSQEWTVQESGTTLRLNDVYFVDADNGWIVGNSSLILHTFNGGEEWIEQNSPVDSIRFEKILFSNSQDGYIVGQQGTILFTHNGGDQPPQRAFYN